MTVTYSLINSTGASVPAALYKLSGGGTINIGSAMPTTVANIQMAAPAQSIVASVVPTTPNARDSYSIVGTATGAAFTFLANIQYNVKKVGATDNWQTVVSPVTAAFSGSNMIVTISGLKSSAVPHTVEIRNTIYNNSPSPAVQFNVDP